MRNIAAHHGNYFPPGQGVPVQNVSDHQANHLPPGQGVKAQSVPDHHTNYAPQGPNMPPHPKINPPACQNIQALSANCCLLGPKGPAVPTDNALANPVADAPPLK